MSTKDVQKAFGENNLIAINDSELLEAEINKFSSDEKIVFLIMSSGNWDGVDVIGSLSS